MVTITYKHNGTEYRILPNGEREGIKTVYLKKEDAKPLTGFKNADRLMEMDTGNIYLFDEEKAGTEDAWLPI